MYQSDLLRFKSEPNGALLTCIEGLIQKLEIFGKLCGCKRGSFDSEEDLNERCQSNPKVGLLGVRLEDT